MSINRLGDWEEEHKGNVGFANPPAWEKSLKRIEQSERATWLRRLPKGPPLAMSVTNISVIGRETAELYATDGFGRRWRAIVPLSGVKLLRKDTGI